MPRTCRVYHNRRRTSWTEYVMEDEPMAGKAVILEGGKADDGFSRQSTMVSLGDCSELGSSSSLPSPCNSACPCASHLLQVVKGRECPNFDCVTNAAYSEYEVSGRGLSEVLAEPDERGWCPMLIAAQRGFVQAVDALIELGAKVNCQEPSSGWTPLMYAAALGHVTIVRKLMAAGADVDKIVHGDNALCIALLAGNMDVARALIEYNANVKDFRCRFPDLIERYAALAC